MNYPAYSYLLGLLARFAWDVILLRHRDVQSDAKACLEHLNPRSGFEAQWLALAIAALVPVRVHWIMTDEFTAWYRPLGTFASRLLLKRIARVYGFTTMPPMPLHLRGEFA